MKQTLFLEYLGGLGLSIYLYSGLGLPWWWYLALFLAPDIGMVGYLAGPRVGAFTYNALHHLGVAAVAYVLGSLLANVPLQLVGTIILGHLFFDRMLGFGLKSAAGFNNTHLGNLKRS